MGVAFGFRVWGVDFGLPGAEARPDELTIAFQAMKFGTGDLNPHSFNYPSLHKYVTFVLFGLWYVWGKVAGLYTGQEAFLRDFFAGSAEFRLLMRLWSVAMGTVGVALLLWAPGRRWSAALLAVTFLHVRDSHFGVTDVTMVTLTTAAVGASLMAMERPSWRALVIAAGLAGLATSTKYNAGLLCLPLALAAGSPRRVGVAAVVMVGAFLLGTPYAALDFGTFWRDFSYELSHLEGGQYVDVGSGWVHHLRTLAGTCGPPYLLLAAAGLYFAPRLGWRRAGVLYGFPVAYFLVIGRGETAFFRYILPVVPFLAVAAGDLLSRLPRRVAGWVYVVVVIPTAWSSVQAVQLMAAGDTRDAMLRYVEANVPSQAVIVHAGTYTGAPMLQRNVANLTREYAAKQGRADASGFRKPDDLTWYVESRPMYDLQFVEKPGIAFVSQVPLDQVLAEPPPWLELEDYYLTHYSAVPDALRALAESPAYTLVHTESAVDGPVDAAWFDQQDALYLPAGNFGGFVRMGPTLRLYRRNPE